MGRSKVDAAAAVSNQIAKVDWALVEAHLNETGHAGIPKLLSPKHCQALVAAYGKAEVFRSRVVMARHGFGRGEYQYFSYPLPGLVQMLRESFYERLAVIANRWQERMSDSSRFPARHRAFIRQCQAAGQVRPTPLLLSYQAGDYNCLHQDLYGELAFPLQVIVLLSQPGHDFDGGELVLTEQRPRMQSRPMVVPMKLGDAAIVPVSHRPVMGTRGEYRVKLRHGVSLVRRGHRYTLGIIFHDAQ